jgi:ketosteroid isomerase-like protein
MSPGNVDLVRRVHRDWNLGGCPARSGLLDAGVEWVNPDGAVEPGTRTGLPAFRRAVRKVQESFVEMWIDVEQCVELDPCRVLVIGTWRGRGRVSHVRLKRRMGFLWTVSDGRACRFEWFHDPGAALKAARRAQTELAL